MYLRLRASPCHTNSTSLIISQRHIYHSYYSQIDKTHLIHKSILPHSKYHKIGFVPGAKRGEEIFFAFCTDLDGIGDNSGRLLLGHGSDVTAAYGELKATPS